MKNNDNKIINIIFRVVIIGAFFMGIRTIYNFYVLMILKGTARFTVLSMPV